MTQMSRKSKKKSRGNKHESDNLDVAMEASNVPINDESLTTPAKSGKKSKRRRSSTGIKDRIWEKKQLQNINIQVDNILSHWPDGMDSSILEKELERMRQDCDQKIDEGNRLNEDKLRNANHQLEDERAKNRRLIDEMREMQGKLNDEQKHARELESQLKKQKIRNNNLERDKNKLENDTDNTINNLKQKIHDLEAHNKELRDENANLGKSKEQREKELERKYNKILMDRLNERDNNFKNLKEQMEDQHHSVVEQLKNQFGKDIEDLEREKERLVDRINDLEKQKGELMTERNELKANVETLRDQIEKAQEKNISEKDKLENLLNNKNLEFKDLQDAYNRLNHDYFCINDIKVELENEIETLKRKLDEFEQKHGIESPFRPKKRRRLNNNTVILDSIHSDAIRKGNFPIVVSKREYEGDWTGFEVQNQYDRPIRMEGWFLSDENSKHKLELPNYALSPNQIVRVVLNGNKLGSDDLEWKIKFAKKHKNKDLKLYVNDGKGNRQLLDTIPAGHRKHKDSCFVM